MSKKQKQWFVPKEFKPLLKRLPDGTWECRTRDMPRSFNVAATADEAVTLHENAWNHFKAFCERTNAEYQEFLKAESSS